MDLKHIFKHTIYNILTFSGEERSDPPVIPYHGNIPPPPKKIPRSPLLCSSPAMKVWVYSRIWRNTADAGSDTEPTPVARSICLN